MSARSDFGELSSAGGGGDAGLCEYGVFLSNLCDCLQTENSEIFRFVFGKPAGWVGARGAARRAGASLETGEA